MKEFMVYGPHVEKALKENRPVVALESTIISHGFPYPENLHLALDLEESLRARGVTPATIGILGGKIRIGLEEEELHHLARNRETPKASLRDLPIILGLCLDGATTVASTMFLAHLAGIRVFVTGGIGGVHRQGEETLDISADLTALSRYDVVVVCAGAKSVLDLPKTLEVLETLGVPVLGYKTDRFPAFYLRDSGLAVDHKIEEAGDIAAILRAKSSLGLSGGVLVTVPIPKEEELDPDTFNQTLDKVLEELAIKGIKGKEVTPYLLMRLHALTAGKSVRANTALVKNNLEVGAEIAEALVRG